MRHIRTFISGIILISIHALASAQMVDSVQMGQGYANDVFYSMASGVVKTEPNSNWHIAFATDIFSSTIITNDGRGVALYTYPGGDVGAWDTLSTDGIGTWVSQYNSPDTVMLGAFDRNILTESAFDFGWGVYNSVNHNVEGDSLFVIQLPDESYKKLWIHRKISTENKFVIQYANLDGSMDTTLTLEINPFTSKNFAYFSLETNELIDREPAEPWDILFTRYWDERIPYLVTGVVSNIGVQVDRITEADTSSSCFVPAEYSERRTVIGSDWKDFNMGTFQYDLTDSLVFAIKDTSGIEYSLYITEFAGSGTGKVKFVKRAIDCTTGYLAIRAGNDLEAYPNPAIDKVYIRHSFHKTGMLDIQIFDITGRGVLKKAVNADGNPEIYLDVSGLKTGLYIIRLRNGDDHAVTRICVR